jgi:hypothetical protein
VKKEERIGELLQSLLLSAPGEIPGRQTDPHSYSYAGTDHGRMGPQTQDLLQIEMPHGSSLVEPRRQAIGGQ